MAYTKQISTAVMYVAGNDGNADLDKFRRPGDPTLLRRHLSRADWADYMAEGDRGPTSQAVRSPAYVNKDKFPSPVPTRTTQPTLSSEPTDSRPTSQTSSPIQTRTPTQTAKSSTKPQPTSPTTTAPNVPQATSRPARRRRAAAEAPPGRGVIRCRSRS